MALEDYLKGHASHSQAPGGDKSWTGQNPGPFLGIVKSNLDPTRMGRLKVFIPTLAKTSDPSENQLITCSYLSPFYGAKGETHVIGAATGYADTQHSYGFWAVPPDLETKVLVIFAEGKMEQAYWIGCVQDPFTNHMMPGIASSTNTYDRQDGPPGQTGGGIVNKKETYGTDNVPSGELNRNTQGALQNGNYDSSPKPIHPLADVLVKQGLSKDDIRGNTSSSARRETPSQVFGISTPGPKDTTTTKVQVGPKDSTAHDYVTRKIGHIFVMDDGDVNGDNQLTRLRTASGHQLLMHDTEGVVYLANGSGKAFIEMARDGTISVYSANGIDFRSGTDFNIHSDTNINFHAKGQINFTSETNLVLNAEGNLYAMGEKGILSSSQKGSVRTFGKEGITSHSDGIQFHSAKGRIDLGSDSQVHLNTIKARPVFGPSWLKPDAVGIRVTGGPDGLIDIDDGEPFRPFDPKTDRSISDSPNNPNQRVGASAEGKEGLQPNKKANKTTVSDFVTHEPYDRKSSQARKKSFINEAIAEIRKSNPGMSATDIQQIKSELLKQPSVKAVADKLGKVVRLNDKIKLPIENLNSLVTKANTIQNIIDDPKAFAMNFIYGKLAEVKSQAIGAVRSIFKF